MNQAGTMQENKPRLVFWEVTKGCNLRCIHCRATATELTSPADLPTPRALDIITQLAEFANPILVLSGGEPLYRTDIFQLAKFGTERGLRVALATNGTLVTKEIARKIVDSGVKRVSISLDGADAETHDTFRGIPGAFEAAIYGFRNLKEIGMPVQINMTIARHNVKQLPTVLNLVRDLGADALHTFLLVPVGCGVDIADVQMVPPEEYEEILNWFYDQEQIGDIELKATCAPHYFRVVRQRRAAERRAEGYGATAAAAGPAIGATEMTMPGSTGINLKPGGTIAGGHPGGHPGGGHPGAMNAVTKGCLAGTGVCFISHRRRGLSVRLSSGAGGRPAQAVVCRHLDQLRSLRDAARQQQADRQVRLLRIPQRVHGLPGAGVRGNRRLHGGRALLRLSAEDGASDEGVARIACGGPTLASPAVARMWWAANGARRYPDLVRFLFSDAILCTPRAFVLSRLIATL